MQRACESCAFYSTSNEDPPDHLLLGCFITKVFFPDANFDKTRYIIKYRAANKHFCSYS